MEGKRNFKITKDYYDNGDLYKKSSVTIQKGLTVLVGCNGIGKTTLMNQIENSLKKNNLKYCHFDNLVDGGSRARNRAGYMGDMAFLATSMCSSEGENIVMNIGNAAHGIGQLVRKNPNEKELWILLDAVDSGLSVDNIEDIKTGLFDTIFETTPNQDVYILVVANEYEFARNENCFDVYNGRYVTFADYEEYRNFILENRKEKDAR